MSCFIMPRGPHWSFCSISLFASTTRQRITVAKVNTSHLCTGGRFHGAGRSFDSISIPGPVTNCLLFRVLQAHRFHFSLRWLPWAWVGRAAPPSSVELFRQCSSWKAWLWGLRGWMEKCKHTSPIAQFRWPTSFSHTISSLSFSTWLRACVQY